MFDFIINYVLVVFLVYLGFFCVFLEDGRNLLMDLVGCCKGLFLGINDGIDFDNQVVDDSILVMVMFGCRLIIVQFFEEIDVDLVVLKEIFFVY